MNWPAIKSCYLTIGGAFGIVSFSYNVGAIPWDSWHFIVDGNISVLALVSLAHILFLHAFGAALRTFLWLPSLIWYVVIANAGFVDWLRLSV